MAAANFSTDVLEMFYGSIESNQGLPTPIDPDISGKKQFQGVGACVENAGQKKQQRPV